jgi:hypothetical protein
MACADTRKNVQNFLSAVSIIIKKYYVVGADHSHFGNCLWEVG